MTARRAAHLSINNWLPHRKCVEYEAYSPSGSRNMKCRYGYGLDERPIFFFWLLAAGIRVPGGLPVSYNTKRKSHLTDKLWYLAAIDTRALLDRIKNQFCIRLIQLASSGWRSISANCALAFSYFLLKTKWEPGTCRQPWEPELVSPFHHD